MQYQCVHHELSPPLSLPPLSLLSPPSLSLSLSLSLSGLSLFFLSVTQSLSALLNIEAMIVLVHDYRTP
jgi:hypothetical protein